jgi:hypothetical protein
MGDRRERSDKSQKSSVQGQPQQDLDQQHRSLLSQKFAPMASSREHKMENSGSVNQQMLGGNQTG